jgi:hypothetical protein
MTETVLSRPRVWVRLGRQVRWETKTSNMSGFSQSDPRVPLKLKGKFYRTAIRPDMLYGAECWPTKKQHVQQLSVVEMCMLRWICDHTRIDRVRNDDLCERLGVTPVEEKFVQYHLRWFGHIQWRLAEAPIRNGVIRRTGNEKRQRKTKLDMRGVREERFEGLVYH